MSRKLKSDCCCADMKKYEKTNCQEELFYCEECDNPCKSIEVFLDDEGRPLARLGTDPDLPPCCVCGKPSCHLLYLGEEAVCQDHYAQEAL